MVAEEIIRHIWQHPANRCARLARVHLRWPGRRISPLAVPTGTSSRRVDLALAVTAGATQGRVTLYSGGHPDWDEMWFLRHYLRPGDGFLDIGAVHRRVHAHRRAIIGPEAASSPSSLGQEVRLAISARTSRSTISRSRPYMPVRRGPRPVSCASRRARTRCMHGDGGRPDPGHGEVPVVRLDDIAGGQQWSLAKVDVEAPSRSCSRAERLLAEGNPPVWLLELSDSLVDFGWSREGVRDWLAHARLRSVLYDANTRTLRPRSHAVDHQRKPALAVARKRLDEIPCTPAPCIRPGDAYSSLWNV